MRNIAKDHKEIFFHVGLGKTASTYLQYRVFPKLEGLHYIQRTKYRQAKQIITQGGAKKYLLSYECDNREIKDIIKDFAAVFPSTKSILVLRRHDGWIASQYRRYVKNARPHRFTEFFDLKEDQGLWKQEFLYFFPIIKALEQHFSHKPLVLFHEDLKKAPLEFIRQIIDYLGVQTDPQEISLTPLHKSYSEKQLKAMRWVSRYTYSGEKATPKNRFLKHLRHYTYIAPLRYGVLYASLLLPSGIFSNQPLIPPEELAKVRAFYQEDWELCLEYARANNAVVNK